MVVRELITLFGVQTDARSMASVDKQISSMFGKIRGMAAIAGAVAGWMMLKGIAEGVGKLGDEFGTLSERMNIATDALQEMSFVAERHSVSRQDLAAGLKALSVNAYEAATGGKEAAASFAKLGVRVRDSEGKQRPLLEVFDDVADGIAKLDSGIERTALTQRFFGRTGSVLVPMLKNGSAGIKSMRQRAQEFGVVMSAELIQKSKDWDASTKDVSSALQGLRNVVADALLPHLERMNRMFTRMLVRHRAVIRAALWKTIDKLGQVVEHVAEFFARAAESIAEMSKELSPLQANLLKVSAAVAALALILALPGGSLLVIIGLLGLLIDDFMVWKKGGKSVIGDLIGSMDDLKATFPGMSAEMGGFWEQTKRVFSTLGSLIKGINEFFGSLVLFLVNVWSDPEVATKDFIGNIKTLWEDFLKWLGDWTGNRELVKSFSEAVDAIAGAIQRIYDTTRNVLMSIIQFVYDVFTKGIVGAFAGIGSQLGESLKQNIKSSLGTAFSFGERALGAFGIGSATAAPVATGRGASNVATSQSNKVDITVNVAGGGQNPEEIGRAVARPVEQVIETQLRNAMLDITNAAPGGAF